MRRLLTALALAAVLAVFAAPMTALGGVSYILEGTSGNPFHLAAATAGTDLVVRGTTDHQSLVMPYTWSTVYHDSTADPRSMQVLSDGSVLFADGFSGRVLRVSEPVDGHPGTLLWEYEYVYQNTSLQQPWSAWLRTDGPNAGDIVLTLRGSAQPPTYAAVLEIKPTTTSGGLPVGTANPTSQGAILWQFPEVQNSTDVSSGKAALRDPFSAVPVPGTNRTLVCDGKKGGGGYRVVELDPSQKIVWSFGTLGTAGRTGQLLDAPRTAQRLPNGDTLIDDEGPDSTSLPFDKGRVLEVRPDHTIKSIFSAGLNAPGGAWQLPNGNTVIADQNNNRVLTINSAQNIIDVYPDLNGTTTDRILTGGTVLNPRAVYCTDIGLPSLYAGWTFVADQLQSRVLKYGYVPGATAVSAAAIDPNSAYLDKTWASIQLDFHNAAHGTASVEYRIDGGGWVSAGPPQSSSPAIYALVNASGQYAVGRAIEYRVKLTSLQHDSAPVLDDVKIGWLPPGQAVPSPTGTSTVPPGGGAGPAGNGVGTGPGVGSGGGNTSIASAGRAGTTKNNPSKNGKGASVGSLGASNQGGTGTNVQSGTKVTGFKLEATKSTLTGGHSNTGPGAATASAQDPALGAIPGFILLVLLYTVGTLWPQIRHVVSVLNPLPHLKPTATEV